MSRLVLDIFGVLALAGLVDVLLFEGNFVNTVSRMFADIALHF